MDEARFEHCPVLLQPILSLLAPRAGQAILDGTLGLGGHATALIPKLAPGGRYIGLDVDEAMIAIARQRLTHLADVAPGVQVDLRATNYVDFADVLRELGIGGVDAVLLDLGVNSAQLADPQRGFSFEREGPLDMRFDRRQQLAALDLVNRLSENELADLFYNNAQEPASRKIARRICQVRHHGRITTTAALAGAVESAMRTAGVPRQGKIHPATRVFQALRIAVNRELENLRAFLGRVLPYLRPQGKLAVISFHSLEDGIVKEFMRGARATGQVVELTRRPVIADPDERNANPRSRSAKLRVVQRTTSNA